MTVPSLADRLAGSLLGLALGDALGFVVEAAPAEVAFAYARDELSSTRIAPRAHRQFRFGQYSDDTQLARALLLRDGGGGVHHRQRREHDQFNAFAHAGRVYGGHGVITRRGHGSVHPSWVTNLQ